MATKTPQRRKRSGSVIRVLRGFSVARLTACCLPLLHILLNQSLVFTQRKLEPLPIKNALKSLNLPRFSPIDLAPDGRLVAYTLQNSDGRSQSTARSQQDPERRGVPRNADSCDIWISDTTSGAAINLTQGRGTNWSAVWSPNGRYLAFYSDREGVPNLWIWERTTGALRKASSAIVRAHLETSVPRWTPDSKRIVITVAPKGETLNRSDAHLKKPATEIDASAESTKEPGSTVVLFSSRPSKLASDVQGNVRLNNNLMAYAVDLAVVDLETRESKTVTSRIVCEGYWLSPDGTHLAVLVYKGRQSQQTLQSLFDLLVVSLRNGQSKSVVSNFGSDVLIPVSWSPDGKFLAYMTIGPTVKNDCWVVSVAGNEPRNVTQGDHQFFDSTILYRGPLWDATGENIYLLSRNSVWRANLAEGRAAPLSAVPGRTLKHIISRNGRTIWTPNSNDTILVVTRNEQNNQEGFYSINLSTGKSERLLEENRSYGFVPALRTSVSDGPRDRLVFTSQSAAEPEEIWTTATAEFRPRRLTHINPIYDRYVMGEGRLIEWQTLKGQTVRGALLLPAGYTPGRRYPLIVYQYPGSMWSTHGNLFGFNQFSSAVENWQFLATRGYAVLMPDVPAKPESYMKDIAAAVLPAIDKVIELGFCDPERVGITGQSNGGYGVLSLIVQTNRFRAAVDRMGPGNLISQYTQMAETGASVYMAEMVQRTGGSLWEKREKFVENSPIFYFDRVQTPLLIIQGTADRQAMVARSDEVFVSLRFLGKEVEYARYEGEPHGVAEWTFPNQVDYLNRVIAWFDLWLKN